MSEETIKKEESQDTVVEQVESSIADETVEAVETVDISFEKIENAISEKVQAENALKLEQEKTQNLESELSAVQSYLSSLAIDKTKQASSFRISNGVATSSVDEKELENIKSESTSQLLTRLSSLDSLLNVDNVPVLSEASVDEEKKNDEFCKDIKISLGGRING